MRRFKAFLRSRFRTILFYFVFRVHPIKKAQFSYHHMDYYNPMSSSFSSACYLLTQLNRPLVYHWRGQGITCLVYSDDGLIVSLEVDQHSVGLITY